MFTIIIMSLAVIICLYYLFQIFMVYILYFVYCGIEFALRNYNDKQNIDDNIERITMKFFFNMKNVEISFDKHMDKLGQLSKILEKRKNNIAKIINKKKTESNEL